MPDSSKPIRLRLAELSPIRVNAEETLNEVDKLNLRLTLDEEDTKDLVISYNPIISLSKHYTNEKVNTKRARFTSVIVNYILNS